MDPPEEPDDRVSVLLDQLAEWADALSPPSRLPRCACDAREIFECWQGHMSPVRRKPALVPEHLRLALSELDDALEQLWRDHRRDSFERLQTRHAWARVQRSAVELAKALAARRDA